MTVEVAGHIAGSVEVRSAASAGYEFPAEHLMPGSRVSILYANDAVINGEDRNLHVAWTSSGMTVLPSFEPNVVYDRGLGNAALGGVHTGAGNGDMITSRDLHFEWPVPALTDPARAALHDAARFLHQASFGATLDEVEHVRQRGATAWIDEQCAMPARPPYVAAHQQMQDRGPEYLPPGGPKHTPVWNVQTFWREAVTASDQLRQRMAFALQQIFTCALQDMAVSSYGGAQAALLDTVYKHALGNYREPLGEVARSPAMGLYLSHLGNRRADAGGRQPDENFAREVMQLFTIGLVELLPGGTPGQGPEDQLLETYDNDDIVAMARVFTGWSWGFDDPQLTQTQLLNGRPDRTATGIARTDIRAMKPYPE